MNSAKSIPTTREPYWKLLVNWSQEQNQHHLQFHLEHPDGTWKYQPIILQQDPGPRIADILKQLAHKSIKGEPIQKVEGLLASKALLMAQWFLPDALRQDLQRLSQPKDQTDLSPILWIVSNDPWIPWEMLKPTQESPLLCEAFAVCRGLFNLPGCASPEIQTIGLLPGEEFTQSDLTATVKNLPKAIQRIPIQSTGSSVQKALNQSQCQTYYILGHGGFDFEHPEENAIHLWDNSKISPEWIESQVNHLHGSFFFINGCCSMGTGLSPSGATGWPKTLLSKGAGGFMGSITALRSDTANAFAQCFYNELAKGKSMVRAVHNARQMVRRPGDVTWCGYSLFSDPTAGLTTQPVANTSGSQQPAQQARATALYDHGRESYHLHSAVKKITRALRALGSPKAIPILTLLLMAIPLLIAELGRRAHHERLTALGVPMQEFPFQTLLDTGLDALWFLPLQALAALWSNHTLIQTCAWSISGATIFLCLGSMTRVRAIITPLIALAAPLFLFVTLFYLAATKPRLSQLDPISKPGRYESGQSLAHQLQFETGAWLAHASHQNNRNREQTAGLLVLFLLAPPLWAAAALKARRNDRLLYKLLWLYALTPFLLLGSSPRIYAFGKWGLTYMRMDLTECESHQNIESECIAYDITEGAKVTLFWYQGENCKPKYLIFQEGPPPCAGPGPFESVLSLP